MSRGNWEDENPTKKEIWDKEFEWDEKDSYNGNKKDKHSKKFYLSQKEYLKRVLDQFSPNETTKLVSIPLAPHFKISSSISLVIEAKREYMSTVPYMNVINSLMYAMICYDQFHMSCIL